MGENAVPRAEPVRLIYAHMRPIASTPNYTTPAHVWPLTLRSIDT